MSAIPGWDPYSFRGKVAAQQPNFDPGELARAVASLERLPPLIAPGEIDALYSQLKDASRGHRFVLHGGDCAERFRDCNQDAIIAKLKIILQMSLVLTYGARRPVVRIGRMAGQYAKPRSQDTEQVNGVTLPTFRGDNVNELDADPDKRRPNAARLEEGYFRSGLTLNYVRALVKGGFASLREPEHWELPFFPDAGVHASFREIASRIRDAIDYFESFGSVSSTLREVDFFSSHEALVLPYEAALTRELEEPFHGFTHYNGGAHLLWIGERTRALDGAHVEYCRGLANPLGLKVGANMGADALLRLIEVLDPGNLPGRLTLITRMGRTKVSEALPPLVRAVKAEGRNVLWSCDPMHGNTQTVRGFKTRAMADIVGELSSAFAIHRAEGGQLGGVHFELTADDVTECLGGAQDVQPEHLGERYDSGCDPRLNYAQSMEIAFLIARLLKDSRAS